MDIRDIFAFRSIAFLQGDEASEALSILENDGENSLLKHLAGYDYGEGDTMGYVPWGTGDTTRRHGNYFLTYNLRLKYVALSARVTRAAAAEGGELDRLEKERNARRALAEE